MLKYLVKPTGSVQAYLYVCSLEVEGKSVVGYGYVLHTPGLLVSCNHCPLAAADSGLGAAVCLGKTKLNCKNAMRDWSSTKKVGCIPWSKPNGIFMRMKEFWLHKSLQRNTLVDHELGGVNGNMIGTVKDCLAMPQSNSCNGLVRVRIVYLHTVPVCSLRKRQNVVLGSLWTILSKIVSSPGCRAQLSQRMFHLQQYNWSSNNKEPKQWNIFAIHLHWTGSLVRLKWILPDTTCLYRIAMMKCLKWAGLLIHEGWCGPKLTCLLLATHLIANKKATTIPCRKSESSNLHLFLDWFFCVLERSLVLLACSLKWKSRWFAVNLLFGVGFGHNRPI